MRGVGTDGTPFTAINDRNAEPALPPNNDVGPNPTTLPSVNGSNIQWRAVSVRGPHGLTTVAIDLSDVQHTLSSLVWLQIGIGVAVLVVVGIASFAVVHRSLRPLTEVEQTAAAIAAGQLDRRVPERDPRTEVGRLSLALNGMLTQIQQAMASSESSAEKARSSEDRMRRFITDASHELRTPLTTIRGFAELYRQGAARDVSKLLSRIESEASRMGLLVDDLLLLARLDVQRPLEHHRVDLLALASDAVHDAQAIDPKRTITMEVFDGPGTPEVLGDEPRIRQVLSNLVANALQHTPSSADVTVRVGTDGDDAVLEVVDEGPGHESAGCVAGVRAVLSHRLVAGALQRRHRTGAVHRRLVGARPRRRCRRDDRARRGVLLPRHAAPRERRAGARAGSRQLSQGRLDLGLRLVERLR